MVFKTRKVPRHLIIAEDSTFRHKPRGHLMKMVFWALLLMISAYLYLYFST